MTTNTEIKQGAGECPNCAGVGHRHEANGEKLPCDLCGGELPQDEAELNRLLDQLPGYLNRSDCDWKDAYDELRSFLAQRAASAPTDDIAGWILPGNYRPSFHYGKDSPWSPTSGAFPFYVTPQTASVPAEAVQGKIPRSPNYRFPISDDDSGTYEIRDNNGRKVGEVYFYVDALAIQQGLKAAATVPQDIGRDAAIFTGWAVYYDNLGIESYTSSWMTPFKLYRSEDEARAAFTTDRKQHYIPKIVTVIATPSANVVQVAPQTTEKP